MKRSSPQKRPPFPEQLTTVFLYLMVLVYPLWMTGDYQTVTQQKFQCFLVLCGGYVLLMALLGIEMLVLEQARFPSLVFLWKHASAAQKLVAVFALCTILSALLSPYGRETLWGMTRNEGLVTILLYCLLFLLVSVFGRADRRLLSALGISVTVVSLLGLVQLAGRNPFDLYPSGYTYYDAGTAYTGAYLSTIGNTDLLAAFLCAAAPLFAGALVRGSSIIRFLYALPLALSLTLLVRMGAAAGIVGILVSALILLPVFSRQHRREWSLCALCVALLSLLAVYFAGDAMGGTAAELSALLHGQLEDHFGSGRIYIWRQVWDLVPERLLFGGGPDTLAARNAGYFQRYDASLGVTVRALIDTAHNEYLNILVNQGLLALTAYLGALFSSAARWLRRSGQHGTAAILGGGVLCYCIQAFFGISSYITTPALWLIWGLLEQQLRLEGAA